MHFTLEEWGKLQRDWANSTCRSVSEYVRKIILHQPVAIYYRNKSFDDFIEEAIALRNEMQLIRLDARLDMASQERLIQVQEAIKKSINQLVDYVRENQKH